MAGKEEIITDSTAPKKVLFIYYSFSGQTGILVNRLAAGMKEQGIEVFFEKLKPVRHLRFPVGSIIRTYLMMIATFLLSLLAVECLPDTILALPVQPLSGIGAPIDVLLHGS